MKSQATITNRKVTADSYYESRRGRHADTKTQAHRGQAR